MKKVLAVIFNCGMLAAFLPGLASCNNIARELSHVSRVEGYTSVDDLIKDSPVIVVGTVSGKNKGFGYGIDTFALTPFTVETTVRGDINGTINILQTYCYEDPYLVKGDRMLLFLKPYTGPLTQDAYRLMGLYQGQYKISGDKVIKNADNIIPDAELNESLANISVLSAKAEQLGYSPIAWPGINPPN